MLSYLRIISVAGHGRLRLVSKINFRLMYIVTVFYYGYLCTMLYARVASQVTWQVVHSVRDRFTHYVTDSVHTSTPCLKWVERRFCTSLFTVVAGRTMIPYTR